MARYLCGFLLLLALAPSTNRGTTCASLMHCWPTPGSVVPTNAYIVLTGYGWRFQYLATIARYRPVLVAPADGCPLQVEQLHDVPVPFTQVALTPKQALQPDEPYTLDFHRTQGMGLLQDLAPACDVDGKTYIPVTWTAGQGVDTEPPHWQGEPQVVDARYAEGPAGHSAAVTVSIPAEDNWGMMLARVELKRLTDSAVVRYGLPLANGQIVLASGACKPFRLETGERYELVITLVDPAGNESLSPKSALAFRIPDPPPAEVFHVAVDLPPGLAPVNHHASLEYPAFARKARLSGDTVVELLVAADGTVTDVHIMKPRPYLDAHAAEALRNWLFEPDPVEGIRRFLVTVRFAIEQPPYEPDWSP